MKITPIQVTIADLTKNYKDDGNSGVLGYNDLKTYYKSHIIDKMFQYELLK